MRARCKALLHNIIGNSQSSNSNPHSRFPFAIGNVTAILRGMHGKLYKANTFPRVAPKDGGFVEIRRFFASFLALPAVYSSKVLLDSRGF